MLDKRIVTYEYVTYHFNIKISIINVENDVKNIVKTQVIYILLRVLYNVCNM
jgi:hypothetical protein